MPTQPMSFEEAVEQALASDPRYQPEAYAFVRDALHYSANKFRKGAEDQNVTGQQLLEGVREHGLCEFGPMAWFLLQQWGIVRGEDVGRIVYNLIECGYFGKKDDDSIEDFAGGFDFEEAFTVPFLPSSHPVRTGKKNS